MCSISIWSQSIQIDFKQFAGQEYTLLLYQGEKSDTIVVGKLDSEGRTTLTLPPRYKDYVGIVGFGLTQGGGLDLVVNKENFTVQCSEAQPNENNIHYIGSPENEYLLSHYKTQQKILNQARIAGDIFQTYEESDPLYQKFKNEQPSLESQFNTLQAETARSPLYAARFIEFNNFVRGVGSNLHQTPEEKMYDLKSIVRTQLDIDALYTSGLWSNVLGSWYSIHKNGIKNDSILLDDAKHIAGRIQSNKVYTTFSEGLISMFESNGQNDVEEQFANYLMTDGRLDQPTGKLKSLMTLLKLTKGSKAPALSQVKLPGSNTLLVFYESGCGPCENELETLKGNYKLLQDKGYTIITISADVDAQVYKNTSTSFPWSDKYCDLKGHDSPDFQNYGVIGTPTMYLIDKSGIIQGRYARLLDTGLISN